MVFVYAMRRGFGILRSLRPMFAQNVTDWWYGMTEKYIYCPSCCTLTIHNRLTGEIRGWGCQECNPPLEDFS